MQELMTRDNDPQALTGPLDAIDTDRLKQELSRALSVTARHLAYLAGIWQELERRGEDLSDLRIGLAEYLPAIAAGTLDPDAVIRFAGKKIMLKRLLGLPLEQQRQIATDTPVAVITQTSDGVIERQVAPSKLKAREIVQVLGTHGLRSADQQRQTLAPTRGRKHSRPIPSKALIMIDRETGALKIGRTYVRRGKERVTADQIVTALSAYYGLDLATLIQEQR